MNGGEQIRTAIAGWLSFAESLKVPLALSRSEALARAHELRNALGKADVPAVSLRLDDEGMDVLWALTEMLESESEYAAYRYETEPPSTLALERANDEVAILFRLVGQTNWNKDSFDERDEVLARLAYVAWRNARLIGDPVASQRWFSCSEESLVRSSSATFLRVSLIWEGFPAVTAEDLATLGANPFLVFALCVLLRRTSNANPHLVAIGVPRVYHGLGARTTAWSRVDRQYSLGSLALIASNSNRLIGHRTAAELWLKAATGAFAKLRNPAELVAEAWFAELALRHESGDCDSTLAGISELLGAFERLGSKRNLIKARVLKGSVLKLKGSIADATAVLEQARSAVDEVDSDLLPFVLFNLCDIYVITGEWDRAEHLLSESFVLAARHRLRTVFASLQTVAGELKRQKGDLEGALVLFSSAVEEAFSSGIASLSARARLVKAETLLALNRLPEGRAELRFALEVFRAEKMAPEALASLALLREIASRSALPSVSSRDRDRDV